MEGTEIFPSFSFFVLRSRCVKKIAFVLSVLIALPLGVRAEGVTANYENQKSALKASRFATLAELRASAPTLQGKAVELKGEVKGTFTRNGSLAALFQPL